jgi:hypothetical protein
LASQSLHCCITQSFIVPDWFAIDLHMIASVAGSNALRPLNLLLICVVSADFGLYRVHPTCCCLFELLLDEKPVRVWLTMAAYWSEAHDLFIRSTFGRKERKKKQQHSF